MSTSPTHTTSEHPRFPSLTHIPKLEPDGSNWAIFQTRFQIAMMASNHWDCFDGSKPCPTPKDHAAPTKEEKEVAATWEKGDQVA
jgi:hypothetical protein